MNDKEFLKELVQYFELESQSYEIKLRYKLNSDSPTVVWDENDEVYYVEIPQNHHGLKYSLIHEISHIYLTKLTNYKYFSAQPKYILKLAQKTYFNASDNLVKSIFQYSNAIVDIFCDYQAFVEKRKYYEHLEEFISKLMDRNPRGDKITSRVLFLKFYPELKFHLSPKKDPFNHYTNIFIRLKKGGKIRDNTINILDNVKDILNHPTKDNIVEFITSTCGSFKEIGQEKARDIVNRIFT